MKILGIVAALLISQTALASGGGSDQLLKTLGDSGVTSKSNIVLAPMAMPEIKLSNPVARQLFADWSGHGQTSIEINQWMQIFLSDRYEDYAHLWSELSPKAPPTLRDSARAAYLYSLYQLDLPQTFFNEWTKSLGQADFLASRASQALEETISSDFDRWYYEANISIDENQAKIIQSVPIARNPLFLSLHASLATRKGIEAIDLLSRLPLNSPYRPVLAQTAAAGLAKAGDLPNAAKVYRDYYEPWLATQKDANLLASHYMNIGRLLYQAGSPEGAIEFYSKIPKGSPEYLVAREELTWCWLRLGDSERLRGNLETLTSKVLDENFQPEAYLVRSISNLKMCYYREVEKDFKRFIGSSMNWAKKIDKNLQVEDPETPRLIDFYSIRSKEQVKRLESELKKLEKVSEKSANAFAEGTPTPTHWSDAVQSLKMIVEQSRKNAIAEYRRQWKNDQVMLNEAIRKMKFVKIELLSQVAAFTEQVQAADEKAKQDKIRLNASSSVKKADAEGRDMVFPYDGVLWADEMFKLRSVSQGKCLGQ